MVNVRILLRVAVYTYFYGNPGRNPTRRQKKSERTRCLWGTNLFLFKSNARANSLDHGASNGAVLSLLRFYGFFELAVGFFHGHGNVDRSFLTFRARLTTIFFFFHSTPAPSPLFRIIIPALLDKIFRPMALWAEASKRYHAASVRASNAASTS